MSSATVPAGAEAVSSPAPAATSSESPAAAGASATAGLKACSGCSRSLHASAFSGAQLKGPAKTRKCMECVVVAAKKAEADAANAAIAAQVQAAREKAAAAAAAKGGKHVKANTPGAIARERAAARNPPSASSSSSSSTAAPSAPTAAALAAAAAASSSVIDPGPKLTKGLKTAQKKKSAQQTIFDKSRKSADQSGKAALLDDEEEWFLPRAEEAFEEIFRRFDSGHPMPPASAARAELAPKLSLGWSLSDTQRFAVATNGRPFGTEELIEIADNLEHNKQGQLTLQGFLDFYHLQTTSHPDETWKDLKKLGYNDKLEFVQQ